MILSLIEWTESYLAQPFLLPSMAKSHLWSKKDQDEKWTLEAEV